MYGPIRLMPNRQNEYQCISSHSSRLPSNPLFSFRFVAEWRTLATAVADKTVITWPNFAWLSLFHVDGPQSNGVVVDAGKNYYLRQSSHATELRRSIFKSRHIAFGKLHPFHLTIDHAMELQFVIHWLDHRNAPFYGYSDVMQVIFHLGDWKKRTEKFVSIRHYS